MDDWRESHRAIEREFLGFIGSDSGLVLKGGTALMLCYGLPRFSEDLDFDAAAPEISTISRVEAFCKARDYDCHVKKDTDTVQRCTVHYGGMKPLKIETSYRRAQIDPAEVAVVDGITTYKLPVLAQMKLGAYLGRERLRDLFDVSFIVNEHWDDLPVDVRRSFTYGLQAKGLERFDAVLADQEDELVDADVLAESFLKAYERVGLLSAGQSDTPNSARKAEAAVPTPSSDRELFSEQARMRRAQGGISRGPMGRTR